jgi:hypothetical protein
VVWNKTKNASMRRIAAHHRRTTHRNRARAGQSYDFSGDTRFELFTRCGTATSVDAERILGGRATSGRQTRSATIPGGCWKPR